MALPLSQVEEAASADLGCQDGLARTGRATVTNDIVSRNEVRTAVSKGYFHGRKDRNRRDAPKVPNDATYRAE